MNILIRYLKGLATVVCALSAASAVAQNMPGASGNPGPPPADNRAVAMETGRQIVGFAGECVHAASGLNQYSLLVMRDCDPNAIEQRFIAEGNRIKTAAKALVVAGGGFNMSHVWVQACVTRAREERLALYMCGSGLVQPMQQDGAFSGRQISAHNYCFDVHRDGMANGHADSLLPLPRRRQPAMGLAVAPA